MSSEPQCLSCGAAYCEEHAMCHHCGSTDGAGITLKGGIKTGACKTQKMRGVEALALWVPNRVVRLIGALAPDWDGTLHPDFEKKVFPCFARPCPMTPQHGFVESRVVKTLKALQKVHAETIAADPEGEVMLMPFIKADFNVIWTPHMITLGPGHDGATSGKQTVHFPIQGVDTYKTTVAGIPSTALKRAGITDLSEMHPFIEAVGTGSVLKLTQLRAGPPSGTEVDFIPDTMTVEHVVQPGGEDLLVWQKRVKEFAPGTVVWHPGGSPSDHYSIHCRVAGVPLVTSFQPTVGQTLKKSALPPPSPEAVLDGVLAGERMPIGTLGHHNGARLMLMGLHQSGAMSGESGFWLGVSAALMLRLGSIACRGEARHICKAFQMPLKPREAVYQRSMPRSLSYHRATLPALINTLRYGFRMTAAGVGGMKWAACGASLMPLFNAVRSLAQSPSDAGVKALLNSLNVAINQAHNNGWWMNKFASAEDFNVAMEPPVLFTLDVIPAMWYAHKARLIGHEREAAVAKLAAWPVSSLRPGRLMDARMLYLPGTSAVSVQLRFKIMKRPIDTNLSLSLANLFKAPTMNAIAKDLVASYTDDGRIRVQLGKALAVPADWVLFEEKIPILDAKE